MGWGQLGVRQSPAQGALCPPDRGLHGSGQQVAAEGPPAAHRCGRRHPGGPAGGHFRAGGGQPPRSLCPAGWPAAAPTCSAQHPSHEETRSSRMVSAVTGSRQGCRPVDWVVSGGESRSRAPALGGGRLRMRHAVPRPVEAGPRSGRGRAPGTRRAFPAGVPQPTHRGRAGTCLPGPRRLPGRGIRS